MATTTVKRGAGRPAATAKSNRHAQRTPLPAKAEPSEFDTLMAIPASQRTQSQRLRITQLASPRPMREVTTGPEAETPAEAHENYGRMTVAELTARAKVLEVKPVPRTKGALLNAILEAERDDRFAQQVLNDVAQQGVEERAAAQAAKSAKSAKKAAPAPATAAKAAKPAAASAESGARKADKLKAEIEPAGWSLEWEVSDEAPIRVTSVARRGAEILTVAWDAGVFNYELSGHLIEDRTTKIRNVSHGRQLALRPAEQAQAELARVGSNRAFRPREARSNTPRMALPFDPATATIEEISAAILGRSVVWVNRISHVEEHGHVTKSAKYVSLTGTGEGAERTIQFCTNVGFRACRLDAIVRIGKPTRRRAVTPGGDVDQQDKDQDQAA